MIRKKFIYLFVVVICITSVAAVTVGDKYFKVAKSLETYVALYKEVNKQYVDEVNPNTLMQTGIDAMLASLDPYTNYISEDRIEDYRTETSGEYGGIGALTTHINQKVRVVMLYENNNAYKAGLKLGDEIISVNGLDISNKKTEEINKLVKGEANTSVQLGIKRTGEKDILSVQVKRQTVKVNNVPYFGMLSDGKSGYVKLSNFTPKAGKEIKDAVENLKEQGATQIVLDLRGNPGGLLMEAVNICNVFIEKGTEVVATRGKISSNDITYETQMGATDTDIPLAVLQNNGSASASEIVAGTIQDYDRGVIIGQNSYGKGLVQVNRPLSYNAQLKVTIAKYYIPSGRCIQALDYSHRNPDGSVGSMPDSLKELFHTKNGRPVFDGGGIAPDVTTEAEQMPDVLIGLNNKGLIFDFATQYYYNNLDLNPDPVTFAIDGATFQNFVSFVENKNFEYISSSEVKLEKIKKLAKAQGRFDEIKAQIEVLEKGVIKAKKESLQLYKKEIKATIEQDIIAHYWLEKGQYKKNLKNDATVTKALEVLDDKKEYASILMQQ